MNPGHALRRGLRIWPFMDGVEEKTTDWYKKVYKVLKKLLNKSPLLGVKSEAAIVQLLDPASQCPVDFMHHSYEVRFQFRTYFFHKK